MNLENLQKQKQAIEAQIALVEFAAKNKPRVEKLVLGILEKHPDIYLCDLTAIKNNLGPVLAGIAANLANRQQ